MLGSHPKTKIRQKPKGSEQNHRSRKAKLFGDDRKDEVVVGGGQEQVLLPALKQPLTKPTAYLNAQKGLSHLIGFLLVKRRLRRS